MQQGPIQQVTYNMVSMLTLFPSSLQNMCILYCAGLSQTKLQFNPIGCRMSLCIKLEPLLKFAVILSFQKDHGRGPCKFMRTLNLLKNNCLFVCLFKSSTKDNYRKFTSWFGRLQSKNFGSSYILSEIPSVRCFFYLLLLC